MKLGSIQCLRAVAVLLVVYRHGLDLQPFESLSHLNKLPRLWAFGSFGVDIFFVISGFIISFSAGRYIGAKETGQFIAHRFSRIIPIYYLATLLYLGVIFHNYWKRHVFYFSAGAILKSIFLLPFFDTTVWSQCIYQPAWTLGFECFFYLLFTLGIIFRQRNKTLFLLLAGGFLLLAGQLLHSPDIRIIFITNPIIVEFLLGSVIYYCWSRWTLPAPVAIGILVIAVGICVGEIIKGFGKIGTMEVTVDGSLAAARLLYWGIPAALLVTGCIFLEKKDIGQKIWQNKMMNLLGNSSYALYLCHITVFSFFLTIYSRIPWHGASDLVFLLRLLFAIGCGILFHLFVERPLLRRLRKAPYSISAS